MASQYLFTVNLPPRQGCNYKENFTISRISLNDFKKLYPNNPTPPWADQPNVYYLNAVGDHKYSYNTIIVADFVSNIMCQLAGPHMHKILQKKSSENLEFLINVYFCQYTNKPYIDPNGKTHRFSDYFTPFLLFEPNSN